MMKMCFLEEHEFDIIDAYLSDKTEEISELVSGYIVRNNLKNFECEECKDIMISMENEGLPKKYLQEVSRGGSVIPSGGFFSYGFTDFSAVRLSTEVCTIKIG